jgi:hypothetical protein
VADAPMVASTNRHHRIGAASEADVERTLPGGDWFGSYPLKRPFPKPRREPKFREATLAVGRVGPEVARMASPGEALTQKLLHLDER